MKIWFPQLNFSPAIFEFCVMNFEYFYKLWNVAFYVEKILLAKQ